jgi:hypothetical protein
MPGKILPLMMRVPHVSQISTWLSLLTDTAQPQPTADRTGQCTGRRKILVGVACGTVSSAPSPFLCRPVGPPAGRSNVGSGKRESSKQLIGLFHLSITRQSQETEYGTIYVHISTSMQACASTRLKY